MRYLLPPDDGERRPVKLAPFAQAKRGRKRSDIPMVQTDPPSQHVRRYQGCPKGCECPKHRMDREATERMTRACQQFKDEAAHNAPWTRHEGYRTVKRRQG